MKKEGYTVQCIRHLCEYVFNFSTGSDTGFDETESRKKFRRMPSPETESTQLPIKLETAQAGQSQAGMCISCCTFPLTHSSEYKI